MILRPVQEDVEEGEGDHEELDDNDGDNDHNNGNNNNNNGKESKERIRGVIFGRSVRSSYCVLHVARYLQEPVENVENVDNNSNNNNENEENDDDDDDNVEPILVRVQFQSDSRRELRSYCRRFCKLGDLLQLQSGGACKWKAIDAQKALETEWQSPRLVVDLTSVRDAQAGVLTVVKVRHWTIQKCQSWQREYLTPFSNRNHPSSMRGGRGGVVVVDDADDSENDSVKSSSSTTTTTTTTKASTTKAASTTTSHGGGLGKRTQGEYVTNFLIHMLMNTDTNTNTPSSLTDPSAWATLDPRKNQQQQDQHTEEDTNVVCYRYQRVIDMLNAGTGVVDAAGGSGHVSMALGMAGIQSTVVDPRERVGKLPGRDRKIWNRAVRSIQRRPAILPPPASAITNPNPTTTSPADDSDADAKQILQYCQPVVVPVTDTAEAAPAVVQYGTMRAWFGAPPAGVDGTFRQPDIPSTEELPVCAVDHPLLSTCSAIIALHPDEATDAIVDTAVARRIPFVIVPCCVFFRLFPHRRKPGSKADPVSTHADLIEYLMAKDESIQRTTLPFQGANVVLWSRFE